MKPSEIFEGKDSGLIQSFNEAVGRGEENTSRVIKFRAWLNMQEEMLHENIYGAEKFGGRDCEIMQYTGVFDKNNVEICEGDILKGTGIGNVVRVWEALSLNNFHHWQETEDLINEHGDIEVIGNIYQNPDLLK